MGLTPTPRVYSSSSCGSGCLTHLPPSEASLSLSEKEGARRRGSPRLVGGRAILPGTARRGVQHAPFGHLLVNAGDSCPILLSLSVRAGG